ncbi:MAG: hypothetical protein J5758_06465 [Abditibacteriota bacterium]|nr:hypothetical protein [Abditibacteriota bacterium]
MSEEYYFVHGDIKEGPAEKADLVRWFRSGIIREDSLITDKKHLKVDLKDVIGNRKSHGGVIGAFERKHHFSVRGGVSEKKWPRNLAAIVLVLMTMAVLGMNMNEREPADVSRMSFEQIEELYKDSASSYEVENKDGRETEKFTYLGEGLKRTVWVYKGRPILIRVDFDKPCDAETAFKALDTPAEGEPVRTEEDGFVQYAPFNPGITSVKLFPDDKQTETALMAFNVKDSE